MNNTDNYRVKVRLPKREQKALAIYVLKDGNWVATKKQIEVNLYSPYIDGNYVYGKSFAYSQWFSEEYSPKQLTKHDLPRVNDYPYVRINANGILIVSMGCIDSFTHE